MKNLSLKISLLCAVASFVSFPSFAGKTEMEDLKTISARAISRKWSESNASPEEISSFLSQKIPAELIVPILKPIGIQECMHLNEGVENQTFFTPFLRKAFEEHEIKIDTKVKDEWSASVLIQLRTVVLLKGTFQDVVEGPFVNLHFKGPIISKFSESEIETLVQSPIKRLSISNTLMPGTFQKLFLRGSPNLDKPCFKDLQQLELTSTFIPFRNNSLEFFEVLLESPYLRGLTHLTFRENYFYTESLKIFGENSFLQRLTHLDFILCTFQDGMSSFVQSAVVKNLTSLAVYRHPGEEMSILEFMAILQSKSFEKLRCLLLNSIRIDTNQLINHDQGVFTLENLTDLNLASCELGDEGIKFLVQIPFKQLNKLNLSSNKVGADGLKAITDHSENFEQLHYLDLRSNTCLFTLELDIDSIKRKLPNLKAFLYKG